MSVFSLIPNRVFTLFFIIAICVAGALSQDTLTFLNEKNKSLEPLDKSSKLTFSKDKTNSNNDDSEIPKNEFSVWGGFSPNTTTNVIRWGSSVDTKYGILALRYARRFDTSKKINLKITSDFIPMAILNYPTTTIVQTAPNRFRIDNIKRSSYAFGPALGVQGNFRPYKKVKPFLNGGGGMLFFNRKIPDERATRLNFIVEFGGGVEISINKKRAITIGYKLSHISNADRGQSNPGYDNNLFYFGYTFLFK